MLEKERGLPADYLLEKIKNAIGIAVRRDYGAEENVLVDIDPATGKFAVALRMQVVEEVENPAEQLTLDQAKTYSKRAKIGGTVDIKLETKQFGRMAAQTAKHIIRQGIREAERLYGQCGGKLQERLGPPEAKKMLDSLGFAPDVTERVCFLIAHHHTLDGVDALDWRILLEADFLVNMIEEGMKADAIQCGREKIFRTGMGLRLMERLMPKG